VRQAHPRVERARGAPAAAEQHLLRALELSRKTRGLSWKDTESCLESLSELGALRGDPVCVEWARERYELLALHGDAARTAQAKVTLAALQTQFAATPPAAPR
jgi:hypothetical protein